MRYVAVDRDELAELRRLVKRAADTKGADFTACEVEDYLKDMDVIKLTAAIEREQRDGNLVFEVKDARDVR